MSTPGAVYAGLASIRLRPDYTLPTRGEVINVFDSTFAPVSLPGAFTDPTLPAGYVPFNVRDIDGKVYVTYAPSGVANQRAVTPGQGFVNVFDENGAFCKGSSATTNLPRHGVSPWHREALVNLRRPPHW